MTAPDPADADEIARLLGEYHRLYTQLEAVRSLRERTQRVDSGVRVPVAEVEFILKEAIPRIDERMNDVAGRLRLLGVHPVTSAPGDTAE